MLRFLLQLVHYVKNGIFYTCFLISGFNANSYAAAGFDDVRHSFDDFHEKFERLENEENEIIQRTFLQAEEEYNREIIKLEQHAQTEALLGKTEELNRLAFRKMCLGKPNETTITAAVNERFKTRYLELFIYLLPKDIRDDTTLQNVMDHLHANPTSIRRLSQQLFQATLDVTKASSALAGKIRLCWSEPIGQRIIQALPVVSHPENPLYGKIRARAGKINMGWGSAILINPQQILSCRHNFNDGCTHTFFPDASINSVTGEVDDEIQGIPISSPTFPRNKEDVAVRAQLERAATIPTNVATIPIHPDFQLAHMEEGDTIRICGYPGDHPLTTLKNEIKKEFVTPGRKTNTFVVSCPLIGGVSGSPVILRKADNSQKIIGVVLEMEQLDPTQTLFINLDGSHISDHISL